MHLSPRDFQHSDWFVFDCVFKIAQSIFDSFIDMNLESHRTQISILSQNLRQPYLGCARLH